MKRKYIICAVALGACAALLSWFDSDSRRLKMREPVRPDNLTFPKRCVESELHKTEVYSQNKRHNVDDAKPSTLCVLLEVPNLHSKGVVWNSDGSKFASFSQMGALITIWNLDGSVFRQILRPKGFYPFKGLAFVNHDRQIVTPPVSSQENAEAFHVVDIESGETVHKELGRYPNLADNVNRINGLAMSADQTVMATVSGYAKHQPVGIYLTKDWLHIGDLSDSNLNDEPITAVFSPDGSILAVGTGLGDVFVYNWRERRLVRKFESFGVGSIITFSPDGNLIAIATGALNQQVRLENNVFVNIEREKAIRVFRISDGKSVSIYPTSLPEIVDIAWSPNGDFIAIIVDGWKTLRLWKPFAPTERPETLALNPDAIALSFSPSGRVLAVDNDRVVTLFQLQ